MKKSIRATIRKKTSLTDAQVKEMGRLLADPDLSLKQIANRFSVTPQTVGYHQRKHFPSTPLRRAPYVPPTLEQAADRRAEVGKLLEQRPLLSLSEIARLVGVSRQRVDQIAENFPGVMERRLLVEPPPRKVYYSNTRFRNEVRRILLETDAAYCAKCRLVKDVSEFAEAAVRDRGYCRECLRKRQMDYYHAHPEYKKSLREHSRKWAAKAKVIRQMEKLEIRSPALARKVRQGELSLENALAELGSEKAPRRVMVEPTVEGFLSAATVMLTSEEIKELRRRL